ncbi:MAG: antitoxin Xre/MbcA/ParS toxin-binding domain-containing protein [Panacagrimonas sp.]
MSVDAFVAELGRTGRRVLLAYFRSAAGQCRLQELEVDRVLLARARRRARAVFGDTDMAEDWLWSYCGALGRTPLELLRDRNGYENVLRELTAIEHGLPV